MVYGVLDKGSIMRMRKLTLRMRRGVYLGGEDGGEEIMDRKEGKRGFWGWGRWDY